MVTLLALHSGGIQRLTVMDELEQLSYDTRVRATMPGTLDPRVVIVDIDNRSLLELGQFPWPRHHIAAMVDNLFDRYGIATLGFDALFAEPDGQGGSEHIRRMAQEESDLQLRAKLEAIADSASGDGVFAGSFAGRPVVLGFHFDDSGNGVGLLPEPTFEDDGFMRHTLFAASGTGYAANLPELQGAALAGGFFSNPLVDADGITRRLPLLAEYDGALYPSLALAMATAYLDEIVVPEFGEAEIEAGIPIMEALVVGERLIPIDSRGAVQIPYRGPQGSFRYISAVDVINGEVALPELLKDRIVIMGATAVGLFDLQSTPVQKDFAGVEVHANVITGILDQSFKHLSPFSWAIELASIIVLGVALTFLLPWLSPLAGGLVTLALLALATLVNLYLWQYEKLLLPIAGTLAVIVGVYVVDVIYGFFVESRSKRQIRRAFSSFLAPELVQQLVDDPRRLRLEGESREMTFLFTDIASFTTFSEKADPEVLVSMLNTYLDEVCNIIMDHGGTVDKIIGDAVFALFNAPLDHTDHAQQAVQSAIEIDRFAREFNEEQEFAFGITRIGVNTGTAVVGNFGGERRFDYTAHGDAVNTAARMEGVNKYLGTRICVSETAVNLCKDSDIAFRPVGSLVLKGKTEGIRAYEVFISDQYQPEQFEQYIAAFELLEQGSSEAREWFTQLKAAYPGDPLVALHLKRLEQGDTGIEIVLQEK